jgi:hypothetical protein
MISNANAKKNKKNFITPLLEFSKQAFSTQCTQAGIIDITMSKTDQAKVIAHSCGVTMRTAQRYMAGETPHKAVTILLFNMRQGINQNGAFAGWRVHGNQLISPTNETINPDIIGRLWLWRNERDSKNRKIVELEKKIDKLKEVDKYINLDIHAVKAAANSLNSLLNKEIKQSA